VFLCHLQLSKQNTISEGVAVMRLALASSVRGHGSLCANSVQRAGRIEGLPSEARVRGQR